MSGQIPPPEVVERIERLVMGEVRVLSDRLPRNRVLVGASLVQGVAQAATAR